MIWSVGPSFRIRLDLRASKAAAGDVDCTATMTPKKGIKHGLPNGEPRGASGRPSVVEGRQPIEAARHFIAAAALAREKKQLDSWLLKMVDLARLLHRLFLIFSKKRLSQIVNIFR